MSNVSDGTSVMVLHQPPFVMSPVNVTELSYSDWALQVLKEINTALSHKKRFIRLLITGLVALVSPIVTATTAAISLSQSVQTDHYVNEMSKNISLALGTQEDIHRKLEQKLDALYEMVQYLSEEFQGLKIRSCLECHAEFY